MVSSFKRLYEMHPVARGLSLEDHCRLLMGGVLPRETENTTVDRYLIAISKLRLGILTEQGEGACSFFRSSSESGWGGKPDQDCSIANINAALPAGFSKTKVKQVDSRPLTKMGVGSSGFGVLARSPLWHLYLYYPWPPTQAGTVTVTLRVPDPGPV